MTIWSKPKDGLELEDDKNDKDTLKNLFDQVIPIYLREVYMHKLWARPLPAMLGDGRPVDLFQLFSVVKMKGGFSTVSENGLWGSVAEECAFSAAQHSCVKLVYVIYLKELQGWLGKVFKDNKLMNGKFQKFKKLKYLIADSQEPKGLLCNDEDKWRNIGKLDLETTGNSLDVNGGKHRSQLSDAYVFNLMHDNMEPNIGESGRLVEPGVCMTETLLSDGGGDLNKVNCIVKSSIDNVKDICIQYDKSVLSAAKGIVEKVISSHKNKMCTESIVHAAQDEVQANGIIVDSEKLGVRDDYDIVISARNVVNNAIRSMRSESSSLREVDNVDQRAANVYDNGEKSQDDYDIMLLARQIANKIVNAHNKAKNLCPVDGINAVHETAGHINGDYGKVQAEDDANVESSLTSVGKNVVTSLERKLESTSFAEMLSWITQVAVNPHDPAIGASPRPSKRKNPGADKYWLQALSVREALLKRRRRVYASSEASSLQKMHPSTYVDNKAVSQSTKRARYCKRHPQSKSQFCTCCDSGPVSTNKLSSSCKDKARKVLSSPIKTHAQSCYHLDASDEEDTHVMRVSVGPHSQAEIPKWTGVASESDSKWLGIKMWAPEDDNDKTLVENNVIGMGRQSSCDCFVSGSSECIRFHIEEKRSRLKLALGVLFYRWKFNCMGEEVTVFWTIEEEKRFKTMVCQDCNDLNKFWKNALKLFPSKTREELISYYFNVFVLQRRSYQNHVTPENIDSDDDET